MTTIVIATRAGRALLTAAALIVVVGAAVAPTLGAHAAWALVPLAIVLVLGAVAPRVGVFARPMVRVVTDRPVLALTFDDGPDPRGTLAVLDLLDLHGHRATFFVIGSRAQTQRALVAEIARRGHEVANHTWDHSYLTPFRTPSRLAAELDRTSRLIAELTGRSPQWFRPPVGILSPRTAEAARRARLKLVHWSATARDGVAATSAETAVARLLPALTSGAILVLHDGALGSRQALVAPRALEVLLALLAERGLRSVTLSELCTPGERPSD